LFLLGKIIVPIKLKYMYTMGLNVAFLLSPCLLFNSVWWGLPPCGDFWHDPNRLRQRYQLCLCLWVCKVHGITCCFLGLRGTRIFVPVDIRILAIPVPGLRLVLLLFCYQIQLPKAGNAYAKPSSFRRKVPAIKLSFGPTRGILRPLWWQFRLWFAIGRVLIEWTEGNKPSECPIPSFSKTHFMWLYVRQFACKFS